MYHQEGHLGVITFFPIPSYPTRTRKAYITDHRERENISGSWNLGYRFEWVPGRRAPFPPHPPPSPTAYKMRAIITSHNHHCNHGKHSKRLVVVVVLLLAATIPKAAAHQPARLPARLRACPQTSVAVRSGSLPSVLPRMVRVNGGTQVIRRGVKVHSDRLKVTT